MTVLERLIAWSSSDQATLLVAGALGGIVRWATLRQNWREGVMAMAVGAICSLYLGPVMLPIVVATIGPLTPGGDLQGLASFLVGVAGISLTGFLIDVFDAKFLKSKKKKETEETSNDDRAT